MSDLWPRVPGTPTEDTDPTETVTEAQLHAAMDAFYPDEDWRNYPGPALDIVLRDMRAAIIAARRA